MRFDSDRVGHWLTPLTNLTSSPLRQCTWHNETTAFITEMTMDNLFHALIHALPTREYFFRVLRKYNSRTMHLVPHYTQYWPPSFARSVGWQILARSLGVSAAEWPIAAVRAQMFAVSGCHCYQQIYGGHSAWMPPPFMQPKRRVIDFRSALVSSVIGLTAVRRIVFIERRNGVRQIVNQPELRSAVEGDATLGDAVRFVVLEDLPVLQQYRLIGSSRSLAGVHGQGLAWTMLLASDAGGGGSSCLEIVGNWRAFQRKDYHSNSVANGVQYIRLVQPNAPECDAKICQRCTYRTCGNVTVHVPTVLRTLHTMLRKLQ